MTKQEAPHEWRFSKLLDGKVIDVLITRTNSGFSVSTSVSGGIVGSMRFTTVGRKISSVHEHFEEAVRWVSRNLK